MVDQEQGGVARPSTPTIPPAQVRATAEYLARMVDCAVVDAATQPGVSTSDQLRRVADKLHDLLGQESCALAVVRHDHLHSLVSEALRKFATHPANVPLLPFKRQPVLGEPNLNMTGDEDGNTWAEGVGWALSWGCQLTFGRDEKTAVPYVQVSLSDDDLRRGITQRTATRAQVAEFARMLAEQFGEPAGPDPRDAEIERLRKEYDEAVVSGPLRETLDAEIERLRAQVDELAKIRVALFGEVRQALTERDEAREEWKRADAEVTRLKRLVGNENVSYDGWDQLSRHDAIVRCEEGWQEDLKARDERDRLRQELDLAAGQQPKFQPGQRVRIGLCDGIVITPKDTTRVQFEGMLHTFDIPTRDVHAIDDIVPAEPRRWHVGDPEPEIGTTVWCRAEKFTRSSNGWHRVDIHTGYASWAWILSVGSEIVEAVDRG